MMKIENVNSFDFDTVAVDLFWNTDTQKEQRMHRIHAYPAKFPAFITTKALEYATTNFRKPEIIADIFCGCGTTALEARRNGINFWGCDINPVATLIARTKSRCYQTWRLDQYFQQIMSSLSLKSRSNFYKNAGERLRYWYKEKQYNELFCLRAAIINETPERSDYRHFFLCAFSNILKATSMWLTKSIKPQLDPHKNPADVLCAFQEQCRMMFVANEEFATGNVAKEASSDIITGNFLQVCHQAPQIDMIITSPPYVTSYEYADLHQLSSLWLGYTDDYKTLREGTIGSLHHASLSLKEIANLNETGFKIVTQLQYKFKSKAHSVAKYFLDMQNVARSTYSILSPDGVALFVIGNTEYQGVRIDNAKHLAESLITAGFDEIMVTKRKISQKILTPYRDKLGKFTTNKDGRKVYSEEFIIIGKKST